MMQQLTWFFMSALLASACQGAKGTSGPGKPETDLAPAAAAPAGGGCMTVKGEALFTQSYCGGARPTPEIEAEAQRQRPLPSTRLLVRPANEPEAKAITLETDARSRYQICLPPGLYYVYMSGSMSKLSPVRFDPSCEQWLKTPLGQIEVSAAADANQNVSLMLAIGCNPCEPPRE